MNHPDTSTPPDAPPLPEQWRVGDARFARAYARTGDQGRAVVKSCIAGLYEALRPGTPSRSRHAEVFASGQCRTVERRVRPWFAMVLGPGVRAPAQVVAAVLPAMIRRVPLVAVFRPGVRAAWPDAVLTALELCGVENVFSPPLAALPSCLAALGPCGPGAAACLGDTALWTKVRDAVETSCWLRPPEAIGTLRAHADAWDMNAVAVAHAGVPVRTLDSWDEAPPGAFRAVLAAGAEAPDWCELVLGPGRESLWDWPDIPDGLFHSTRALYERG